MRYALIENNAVTATREMPDNFNPAEIAHKYDFRLVVIQSDPVYDPLTHKLQGWDYVINPTSVAATRAVVALTQEEIDAAAQNVLDADEREQAKVLYASLKAGTASLSQVQRILARVIRDLYQ